MHDKVKIAAIQMDPKLMANRANLDKILLKARVAAGDGADLIVFPECALTGYVFASREEAIPFMETLTLKEIMMLLPRQKLMTSMISSSATMVYSASIRAIMITRPSI